MLNDGDRRSVTICSHILEDGLPILRIKRDELDDDDPSDSGWQLLCASGKIHDNHSIRIISLDEAKIIDSTINDLLDSNIGSVFSRNDKSSPWVREVK